MSAMETIPPEATVMLKSSLNNLQRCSQRTPGGQLVPPKAVKTSSSLTSLSAAHSSTDREVMPREELYSGLH